MQVVRSCPGLPRHLLTLAPVLMRLDVRNRRSDTRPSRDKQDRVILPYGERISVWPFEENGTVYCQGRAS